jgi:hypothetical protein
MWLANGSSGLRILVRTNARARLAFMYSPAVLTLRTAFERFARSKPAGAIVIDQKCPTDVDPYDVEACTASLRRGDLFVWVGAYARDVPWKQLRARGVRTMYYRTEAAEACLDNDPRAEASDEAPIAPDETWEYTWTNVHNASTCPHVASLPTSRFLPPGAVETPRVRRKRSAVPTPAPIFFVGQSWLGPTRGACLSQLERELPPNTLRRESAAWTAEMFRKLIKYSRITAVVNIHKHCSDASQPLETFRVAAMCNYGVLVLSEHSDPRDEAAYAGLVLFAPVRDLSVAYRRWIAPLSTDELIGRINATMAEFAARFDPTLLFRRAGVDQLLERLYAAGGARL